MLVAAFAAFLLAYQREKFRTAWGLLLAASLIKPAALIPAAAWCGVLLAMWINRRSRQNFRRLVWAGLTAGLNLLLVWLDSDGAVNARSPGILSGIAGIALYLPPPAAAACAGLTAGIILTCRGQYDRERLLAILWTGFFFAGYLFYSVSLPRYAASAVPVLVFLAAETLPGRHWTAVLFLAAGILLQNGALYRPLPGHLRHSGEFLERSREWVRQQETDLEMCRFLEQANRPVVAKWPYVHMLAEPAFGYVSKPLEVYSAGITPPDWKNVKKYPAEGLAKNASAYYIFVCNSFEFFRDFGPPLAPREGCLPVWQPENPQQRGFWLVYRR